MMRKLKRKWLARLATECAGLYSIEECDTEMGTVF